MIKPNWFNTIFFEREWLERDTYMPKVIPWILLICSSVAFIFPWIIKLIMIIGTPIELMLKYWKWVLHL